MQSPVVLCDVCHRRPAVYLRTYSGHRMCLPCLEKVLAKAVKKGIGESSTLTPRSRILVPVRPSEPSHSLAAIDLLARVEEKFDATLIILAPRELEGDEVVGRLMSSVERRVKLEVNVEPYPYPVTSSAIACIRHERAWSLHHARRIGADAVAYPLSRTCMNLLGLEGLLAGDPEALSESLPALPWTRPRTLIPTVHVEAEALTVYAILKNLYRDPLCRPAIGAKIPLMSIMGRRPELEFSSHKTITRIAAESTGFEKCPACGGYTRTPGPCKYCRMTGASAFLSTPAP